MGAGQHTVTTTVVEPEAGAKSTSPGALADVVTTASGTVRSSIAALLDQVLAGAGSSSTQQVNDGIPSQAFVDQVLADLQPAVAPDSADLLAGLDQLLAGLDWVPDSLT